MKTIMKTLHTIYNNFAKRVALILTLLSTIGTTAVWGADIATRTIYNDPPLECTTTPTTLETGKPVTYCFSNCDITSSDAGLDWYNGITLTIEVPSEYNIAQITIEPYASSDLKDVVLQTTGVEGTITNVDKFVWTASDQITQTIPQIVLKQSNSSGQSTRIKSISVTYQSSTMSTITWKVDGETYTEGNPSFAIANGEQIGVLPTIPDNCNEDMLFVGWTADENNPADYFYDAVSSPIITTSTTFHAVYASIAEEFAGEKKNTLFAEDVIYASTNDGYQSFTAETHAGTWTGEGVYNSNGYIQINKDDKNRYIGSPEFSGTVKTITITTIKNPNGQSSTANKIYYICSSNTELPTSGNLGQHSTTSEAATFTIDISDKNANQFYIYVNRAVYITKVEVTYKDHTYENHTTICSPDVTVTLNPNGADGWTDNTIDNWDGPDGDGYYSKIQEKNTDFILPTPTRTGYDFGGWEDDKGSAVSSPYETKSNVTLTAQWTPLQYKITYKDQGDVAFSGENAASLPNTHTYGTPTILVDGEKTGYTFGGWYDNSNCTGTALEELAADTYINAITLYAKWTANTYTVHFNANGGEGTMTEQVFTYDVSQPLSENSFTWEGYNFNGWNTQANGGGDSYADKESVSNLTSEPNGEITLFAQWTLKELENYRTLCTYAIILENNYTNPDNNTLDGSATIVATHTSFTSFIAPAARAGYVIEGYYAEPECNTKVVNSDGTLISNVPNYTDADGKWIGEDVDVLYTKWIEVFTVTYDPNGATSGTAPVDNNYYQIGGKVYVLGSNDLQKENYAFGGWNTQADGLGDNYEEGEDFNITKNTTLYAKWDCATYVNITKGTPVNGTFNLSVTGTQYTCEDGFVVSVTDIVPATGYLFDHITQDGVDAANVMIDNNAQTVTYDKLSNGSSTINVVFVAIPYTVTWDPNGGNWGGSTANKVETYNYGASITRPADPTRTGYTFAGWSPAPEATMPAADQTYTAQWDCVAPTDLHIEGEYIHFPGDDMTLTVMGDNIADGATYVWKKGGQVVEGQTTATLTINHCDVTHAGNYVCTVTNGSCSAEANFTVKIFHLYGLKDNTWTQPYVFMKDAEANKAILYVDLDAATSYDFKLKNGQEWYWNEGTMTHNNCTDWTMPQEGIDDVHGNTWITTTVAGTYAFKLDYTDDANLVLSVVYPAKQMIYLDPGVWDIDGAIFVAHVWTEGIGNDKDIRMTKVNDCADREIYEAEIEGAHNRVIFVRCNPSGFSINNIWEKEWNRSSTQWLTNTLPGYQFNIEEWSNGGTEDGKTCSKGSWSAFIPYHTISYDMNGHGTQISDECIKEGNTWSAPTDPTEVGYTFQGWRRPAATGDSKLYKNGQTGYKPTASETLTAQWQINQCVVTWKVNAQEVAKTTIDITNPLTSIPHTPTDDELGCCAEKFIGWSTETNPTKNQVYTTASELQNLIGTLAANTTKTFHAVFATPVPGAGNSLVTFNEMGYANEEAVVSVTLGDGMGNGDATITFNKGTAATYVPTYYNIGEAVRTYAGNTITVAATYANTVLTQIDFAFAKGENANAITASTGTITDGVWTGNAQSVTFTISGATGHRRIASIAITTAVTGDQYTNYVTKCDLSGSASIGAGTITYAVGNAIEVKCGQRSPASKAATLTFASAQDLTCPVTIEASAGFLVSTNKNDNSKYASNITVKPVKTGANKGKLPTIYVRAEANFGVSGQMNGTITASGDEITTTQVNVVANVTCTQYTLTVVDHLGNTISTTQYYEGDEVAEVDDPATDDCSKDYTFDGWSETSVEYGSLIYNKVSFPFTMPANDVTLYPVYVCSKDYHRVTKDLGADNWEGQYLIAHSNTEFANGYQGGTTDGNCIGGTNSVRDLSQYITNDVVSKDCDIRSVKLIAVNGGYVLQTRDGKYNYITASVPSGLTANDNLSTADDHPLTIIFNSETDIAITNLANVNQASLQYSATYFRFYKPGNQNPVYLYKKYLYTTPLICGTIEAEDAVVTSTAGQTIKVNVPITITSTLGGTTNITAESDNDHFTVTPLENVATGEHTIAVHYTPDATTDGTESANITLTASHGNRATTTFQVTGRHLPENFVIAAKWGENWYVLPADMTSESITEGLLIEVDDPSDPTKALAAPNTTKYGLKSVYTTSGALDRYKAQGENIVFVENITGNNKTLYNAGGDAQNSTNTNIQVYAQYKTATGGYYETYPGRYEWIPTTTDLKDYTLTSAHTFATEAARTVSLDNHGIFGTLLQDKSYNGMVRLLPVDNFYETVELQVVEWKQNSVSVMYTGAGTKYTTQVGNNAESSVQLLSKIDHVVYSLSTSDLTTATNQPLIIYIKDDANATIGSIKLTIPAIVATDKSSTELSVTAENAKATNIVILDGATLTAGTTKYTYNDVVVYPGGNLVIDTDGKLGMYTLTLRAGSSWGATEYEHKYPQFLLKGDYSNTSGQINLDYVTTADYYYPLSVPEEVTIGDIKYPVDIYGSNVDKANTGSFQLKYYDGAQRVDQGSQYGTGWVVVDETKTQTLTPNQGYAIWGIPKKINGTRQTYGIHRIPIKKAASDLITNETTTEEIAITAHGDASTPPNDRGWNYLGNPYLAGLGTNDDTDVQMGLLVQEMIDGKWTGGWVNNGEQVRYVTLTNDCQNFEALPVSKATILPFTTFFIQAAQDGAIALNAPTAVAATASVVARRYAAQQETAKEITTGIILTGNDQTDRTGLLIADNFTEEYDYNADLSKFENSGINLYTIGKDGKLAFMAINQALAEQPIPVGYTAPAEGLYTIAFDEDRYNATDISALYLIDYDSNEKTNLLHTDYSFVTAAGTNNQRFALQVAFAPENATNVEWVGDAIVQVGVEGNTLMLNNLPTDAAVHVFDALGRLMYHAPTVPTEMQLTLPTGYYLVRIADKQNAVVIKTVIP